MTPAMSSGVRRVALAVTGWTLVVAQVGCGGQGSGHMTAPATPRVTTLARTVPEAPAGPLTISSPAIPDGAPVPVQYTCSGGNIAPPLAWSTPSDAALVVDDPNAVHGVYVHWIVVGIPPGPGSTADGQTPAGATSLPNTAGQAAYTGPCPPPGTGVHHYRFTLYEVPAQLPLAPGLGGLPAVQAISQASTGQAQFTGIFGS